MTAQEDLKQAKATVGVKRDHVGLVAVHGTGVVVERAYTRSANSCPAFNIAAQPLSKALRGTSLVSLQSFLRLSNAQALE